MSGNGGVRAQGTVLVVTGTSKLAQHPYPIAAASKVRETIRAHTTATHWVTGGQVGVDVLALLCGLQYHPGARHDVWCPAKRHGARDVRTAIQQYADRVVEAHGTVAVHHCLPGTDYRYRNLCMLQQGWEAGEAGTSTEVLAFPLWPQADPRSKFSGTWLTVRLAKATSIAVTVVPLWLVRP